MSVDIRPIPTNKSKIKLRPLMKNNSIPSFAQSILLVGASGSGKTTVLLNLMTRKEFYKDFFDFVFLFSITAELDDTFNILKIPDRRKISNEKDMIEGLKSIVEAQKELIETRGLLGAPKVCLIFEDLTANKKLMRSKAFTDIFTAGRHLNLQVIVCIHKYKSLPRTQRLQAMNIIYFRGSKSEVEQLAEDFTPPRFSKKEFIQLIEFATDADKDNKHNFLYICNKVPFKIRYRKNFTTVLELNK